MTNIQPATIVSAVKQIKNFFSLIFLCILFPGAQAAFSQGETAVPFLLIPSSPAANGMSSAMSSTNSDDPWAGLANPGHLGLMSLTTLATTGIYPGSTNLFQSLSGDEITFSAYAVNAGLILNRRDAVPFTTSLGVGIARINHGLGTFQVTQNSPTPIGSFEAEEHSTNFSVALGLDYFVQAGVGLTLKFIGSSLAPFNVNMLGKEGVASARAIDLGLMLRAPLADIFEDRVAGVVQHHPGFGPIADLSLGYSLRNVGGTISYIDDAQADLLPRNATLGIAGKFGIHHRSDQMQWEVLSVTVVREADDITIQRFRATYDTVYTDSVNYYVNYHEPPPPEYTGITGAIQIFNNIILGEGNTHVTLHKGVELNFGEFVQVRAGSIRGRGVSLITNGWGIRLAGVFKIINWMSPSFADSPVGSFLLTRFDLRFDHASREYDDPTHPNNGVTFNGLSLVIH